MKIRTIITTLTAALALSATAAVNVSEIEDYAFPGNRPAAPPSFTYAPDGNGYLLLSDDGRTIDRYDLRTGERVETVFDVAATRESVIPAIEGFEMSANGSKIMVYREAQMIYRRSFTAEYYVYDTHSRILRPLSTERPRQQAPIISPDSRMVAYVADNNIYIKKLDYNTDIAVTKDGERNRVINGVPDWVYEEEFTTTVSMTWAPDNLTLCYLRYDETDVPLYTLPIYQGTCDPQDRYRFYPGTYAYKYPVAGVDNSRVTVHSYDVETRKIKDLPLPDSRIEYIPRIRYASKPEQLMVVGLNRDQNRMEIYCVNPKSTVARSVCVEECTAWVMPEAYEQITWMDDCFVVMSSRTGYNHLYKYTYAGAQTATLTSGDFDVTDFYGYDAKGNYYYQAASPTPMDRTIYRVDRKGVTTAITPTEGTSSAYFTPDMTTAMITYSSVTTPPVYTLCNADGKKIRTLEDNARYAARYASDPKKEFFTMESDGYTLNGYIIRPAGAKGPAPCIMSQYSGPGSQSVLNRWSVDWEQYFAKQGYVVVCVDGRGTGGRGRAFSDVVYRHLGRYETEDQIAAAQYAASLAEVDASRIGIYGWSYGGYEALMAASQTNSPYAAVCAIAAVTDWRYYDTVYAERYMLTPQQNEDGYRQSAPLNRTALMRVPLLMMYGTADDNVHPENTLQYISTLQSKGKMCDMFVFPNMNHSINGCNARAMVYARMLDFFNRTLK